jgi:GrpB-like predicted nucleotidyltransferase (UPF0157 family)
MNMLGLHKDKVELQPYDEVWKTEFEKEKKVLAQILKEHALQIEHVGSTAIAGLSAKPIIDIAVAVKDKKTLQLLMPIMQKHGYDMLDNLTTKGEILARKGTEEKRTHYIHMEVINSTYWNNHILFRDYLLNHPKLVKEYERLKQEAQKKYKEERKKYTQYKNEFIQSVLKRARNLK